LKIAILIVFPADPGSPNGGVEAVSVSLIRGLARIPGLDVHVVTLNQSPDQKGPTMWEGATIHRLPAASGWLLPYSVGKGRRQIQAFLRQLQPDLVHAHDTFGIMVKGFRSPRVFTVHGFIHQDTLYSGENLPWLRSLLWRRVETTAWADQRHIVSISPYVREYLRGLPGIVIHDIENPIADECFTVARREKAGTIFCAASVCQRKNTLGLLEAFALLARRNPEARLRWAGPMPEPAYEKAVRRYIENHDLGGKVTLLGAIGSEQIRLELAQAAVFVLVSFEEGAPMGIAEAMAAGLPIVTSNRCGMPYMVQDEESGFLVDPGNAEDIASRMNELLGDDELRARMGALSRKIALDRFFSHRVAEKTLRVYQRAVRDFNPVKKTQGAMVPKTAVDLPS
jgi:glycosyltransferase involved in cell wall biosynthesis